MFNHTTGLPVDISSATLTNNGTTEVTWNLASVTCIPSDGTVTVTVTAEDDIGNSASDSDTIEEQFHR